MDSNQPIQQNVLERVTQGGRRNQLIVVAIGLIIATLVWSNWPATSETCALIEGCRLRSNDLQRIQIALGNAGLNEFEVQADNILVPKRERNLYLQAVSEGGALPDGISLNSESSASSINPLLSRSQHEAIQLEEKKKQIRDMVMRLDFVDQAWFEMDRVKARNSFQSDQQSSVIVIQPTGQQRLEFDQVETLRGMISGAITGMKREHIVVTDLNAGIAYENQNQLASASTESIPVSHQKSLAQESRYENEIRKALESIPGIEVAVRVENVKIHVPDADPAPRIVKQKPPMISVGTNGQAAIVEQAEKSDSEKTQQLPMLPLTMEKVFVSVEIPERILLADSEISDISGISIADLRLDHAYRAKLLEVKNDVIARVRPLIPTDSFQDPSVFPISVSVMEEPGTQIATASEAWYMNAIDRVGGPVGAGGILALAALIVVFVFSGTRRNESTSGSPATIPFPGDPGDEDGLPEENSIKQEISKLIEEDPEAAAQVIKRWIRNTA